MNHVGFIVDNVQQRVAQWKAAGVTVLPGGNGRLDQAYVVTPDGVRIEILEDKTQSVPIRNEHVHFSLTGSRSPEGSGLVCEDLRRKAGTRTTSRSWIFRGAAPVRTAAEDRRPTLGRVLDHIGFDVKDHPAFVKKIQAEGIKLDEPVRKSPTGSTITYITDPWGTRVEIIERAPLGPQVQ